MLQVYGNDTVSFVIPISNKEKEFMIGRGRDLCRLHWDFAQKSEEPSKSADDEGKSCSYEKPLHWVVVMAKVDRHGEFYNNRFNDGKCDPLGRLWAGRSPLIESSLWLKKLQNH